MFQPNSFFDRIRQFNDRLFEVRKKLEGDEEAIAFLDSCIFEMPIVEVCPGAPYPDVLSEDPASFYTKRSPDIIQISHGRCKMTFTGHITSTELTDPERTARDYERSLAESVQERN